MKMRSQFQLLMALMLITLFLGGCSFLLPSEEPGNNPSPRIFNLSISPEQIMGDTRTALMLEFDYYDPEGDIDINSRIVVQFDSDHPMVVSVGGEIDQLVKSADGTGGTISKAILIDTTGVHAAGLITLRVSLFDSAGHQSNMAYGEIELLENASARRISACELWFVDQPEGTPTLGYRIGREVFLMVEDLTLGVLEPDVLYAEISSPSGGWSEVVPMYRTGDPTIYASRFGPRLGVNVPARSGQTLLAFYRSFTDRQEICLAQARVF